MITELRPMPPSFEMRAPQTTLLLEVDRLKAYYKTQLFGVDREVRAVDDVSLKVSRNEIYGLAGESSSGKSSLIKTIAGAIRPPLRVIEGSVRFNFKDGERDIYKLSPQELSAIRWSHLSYIMQGSMSVLNPVRRIKHAFVDFALPHVNVKGADFTNLVERHLKRVHLDPAVLQAYPHELSGGMRQRVTIALATVCGPEFIIADEPTTALDVIVQKGVLLMLREIQQELKSSVLFVTHDMAVHANLTDRLGIMYAGRLVEEGRTRDLFKKPLHPYTAHLISSLPRIGDEAPKKGLEGTPPSLANPPPGCRFHPRCPLAIDICRREAPPMVEILPGHRAACHVAQADPTRVETVT
ncbi:peptide ABC transporter ATP-binding protein [Microvirga aerophila]|uniref:Peptide ABC transporter ATP-binding protein n=2 Tax=Microvirga aerophila TaxID=670291 RepID=A0A512BWP3_9HYPH|nr:peptide ABC transporter ATP-binding protein [Microvirga aerophila]